MERRDCKNRFPLNTGFRYAQIPLKTGLRYAQIPLKTGFIVVGYRILTSKRLNALALLQ